MPEESRSSRGADENLGDMLGAATASSVNSKGNAQYFTPSHWARHFVEMLPSAPSHVFEPQAGDGALVRPFGMTCVRFGVELDRRFADPQVAESNGVRWRTLIHGSCVQFWNLLDEFHPNLRFECQVANPPFSLRWKLGDDGRTVDSVEHTWAKITERAAEGGHGFFIAGRGQLERLGIHKHPWAYLYSTFPGGLFPGVGVEIAVVHWHNARERFRPGASKPSMHLHYGSLNPEEHQFVTDNIQAWYARNGCRVVQSHEPGRIADAIRQVGHLVEEERKGRPEFNVALVNGVLRLRIDHLTMLRRRLADAEVKRVSVLDGLHPLMLVQEVETRRLLEELRRWGLTVQPEAAAAIDDALKQAAHMARPILPVTDFERVAYADDMDALTALATPATDFQPVGGPSSRRLGASAVQVAIDGITLTCGNRYPLTTGTYRFVENFSRRKAHYQESTGVTTTVTHNCTLSGEDRYIQIIDDIGLKHRFMDRPSKDRSPEAVAARLLTQDGPKPDAKDFWCEHPDSLLWKIFERPEVTTLADAYPAAVEANRSILANLATTVTA